MTEESKWLEEENKSKGLAQGSVVCLPHQQAISLIEKKNEQNRRYGPKALN
jgi:hypothetical protein